jgi:hypothetical protein
VKQKADAADGSLILALWLLGVESSFKRLLAHAVALKKKTRQSNKTFLTGVCCAPLIVPGLATTPRG